MTAQHDPRGDNDSRVFFVLGMHRSGTSCLIACLESCGVEVGHVQRVNINQPRGNLEQAAVIDVNDRLLARAGGSWKQPPQSPVEPTDAESNVIASVLSGFQGSRPAALKDPRLLFTIDGWLAVADQPALIGTFRHPAAVATSLRERDGMSAPAAHALWRRYNEQLIALHCASGFPLVEFDLAEHEAYCNAVAAVAAESGLLPGIGAIHGVVEKAGRREPPAPDGPVPDACAEMYEYLRAHRHTGRLDPATPAARLLEIGMSRTESVAISGRHAVARGLWRAMRSMPHPVRHALRPVQQRAISLVRRVFGRHLDRAG